MLERGYLQVYTGEGKGKTTAAIGLSIRAIGAGLKVAFLQFFKPPTSSEVKILQSFPQNLLYASFYSDGFARGVISPHLEREILKGYTLFKELLKKRTYDMIVLDEFVYALRWKIIELSECIEVLKNKPSSVEIIITGRGAPEALIEIADLVTEMRPIKHYFDKGILARWGIEK